MGALETKKQYVFSGYYPEECSVPPALHFGHATKLDDPLSSSEFDGIQDQIGEAKDAGNLPTTKVAGLLM